MQTSAFPKPVIWVGPSRRELQAQPRDLQRAFGLALWRAQCRHAVSNATLLQGSRLRGVLEVREDFDRRTYRMMIITSFDEAIYVLRVFPKKATHGIKTPARLVSLVEKRLRDAREIHASETRR